MRLVSPGSGGTVDATGDEAKRLIAKWPSKDQTLETIGIVK